MRLNAAIPACVTLTLFAVSCSPPRTSDNAAGNLTSSNAATEPAPNWTYGENRDEMRGATTRFARAQSTEEFPDSFGTKSEKTELTVQKTGSHVEVDISNPGLQFTCSAFMDTVVAIKFDAGPITKFGCTESQGDKFGVAFITPGARFAQKLKSAKHLALEANVFQRGGVQMNFDVAGLKL